jgi:hypothetical protein
MMVLLLLAIGVPVDSTITAGISRKDTRSGDMYGMNDSGRCLEPGDCIEKSVGIAIQQDFRHLLVILGRLLVPILEKNMFQRKY